MDACREQGIEEPTWRWDGGFVIVTFKRPSRPDNNENTVTDEGLGKVTAQPLLNLRSTSAQVPTKHRSSTGQVPHHFHTTSTPPPHQFHTSSTPVQILIENGSGEFMSALELAALCGLKNIWHFRKYYLNPALADGVIERLYPDRPNHPKQKYRLTEAAREWKKNQSPDKP